MRSSRSPEKRYAPNIITLGVQSPDRPARRQVEAKKKREQQQKRWNQVNRLPIPVARSPVHVERRMQTGPFVTKSNAFFQDAFNALVPVLERVLGVSPLSLFGEQRRLAQRVRVKQRQTPAPPRPNHPWHAQVQNRLELRMIIMDATSLKMIGPGQYKSMGTGGMKPEEACNKAPNVRFVVVQHSHCKSQVRALAHKLFSETDLLNTSLDAQRLLDMLNRKVTLVLQPACVSSTLTSSRITIAT